MEKDELVQMLEKDIDVFEAATDELKVLTEIIDENYCGQTQTVITYRGNFSAVKRTLYRQA